MAAYNRAATPSAATSLSMRCLPFPQNCSLPSPAPAPAPLQNYKRCGDPFINYLSLNPVHDATGRLTHYVGVQASRRWRCGWVGCVRAPSRPQKIQILKGMPCSYLGVNPFPTPNLCQ